MKIFKEEKLTKKFNVKEEFSSKVQQRYFYAQADKGGKEGKKWEKMADEFSKDTDFEKLPNKVDEEMKPEEERDLRELSSFAKRINYLSTKYEKLASGSARVVFKIDNNYVIKLAKNQKGIAQNEVESDWSLQSAYQDIIAPVVKQADDDSWLVSRFAKKITKSRFKEIKGYSFEDFSNWLTNSYSKDNPRKYNYSININKDIEKIINDDEFANEIRNMYLDYDMPVGDLRRLSSYGEIDGKVVLTDYGVNNQVFDDFYSIKRLREEKEKNVSKVTDYLMTNPNFMTWFSSASEYFKEKNGTPKLFFHGTNKDFDEFHDENDIHVDFPTYYFTDDVNYARAYAMGRGANIIPIVINAKKIFDCSKPSHLKIYAKALNNDGWEKWEIKADYEENFYNGLPHWSNYNAILIAKENGFDGIFLNEGRDVNSFCLFNKNNFKSIFDRDFKRNSTKLIGENLEEDLRDWFKEKWKRIDTQGTITGECGSMKDGKKTTRCLPSKKAYSLSKSERKSTVTKKTKSNKQFVKNTEKAECRKKSE